jgi:hypothetical protein
MLRIFTEADCALDSLLGTEFRRILPRGIHMRVGGKMVGLMGMGFFIGPTGIVMKVDGRAGINMDMQS